MQKYTAFFILAAVTSLTAFQIGAAENVMIVDVPDYSWHAGCFGSASGNMMGYWDRNGFPNFYTGLAAGGVAPLNSGGADNVRIRSLWASKAGFDGRPANQPGHLDDYWKFYENEGNMSYESAEPDPYLLAGRAEHTPDCTSDFMGSSQNKWTNLDGECSGNIDAFSFNFWDKTGARRLNFTPPSQNGAEVRDIQSGWRKWTESRGNRADVFSQQADFNYNIPVGTGFTFNDLKAEINAGYPVMLFLQNPNEFSRPVFGLDRANPVVHGMLAYGYVITSAGRNLVRYRTSWGSGDNVFSDWGSQTWQVGLTLRGVIGYHPLPQITSVTTSAGGVTIKWDGPSSRVMQTTGAVLPVHYYVIEKSDSLAPGNFTAVTTASTDREATIPNCCGAGNEFFRVKLLPAQ